MEGLQSKRQRRRHETAPAEEAGNPEGPPGGRGEPAASSAQSRTGTIQEWALQLACPKSPGGFRR